VPASDLRWTYKCQVTMITEAGRKEIKRRKNEGAALTEVIDLTNVAADKSVTIALVMQRCATISFADAIGFAHCCHKQQRLVAGAAVLRVQAHLLEQRKAIHAEMVAGSKFGTFSARFQLAKAAARANQRLHASVEAWTPPRKKEMDNGLSLRASTVGAQAQDIIEQLGIAKFFSEKRATKRYNAAAAKAAKEQGEDEDEVEAEYDAMEVCEAATPPPDEDEAAAMAIEAADSGDDAEAAADAAMEEAVERADEKEAAAEVIQLTMS
jgi:hypothetical protein